MDIFGNFSKLKGDGEKRTVTRKAEIDYEPGEILSRDSIGKIDSKSAPRFVLAIKVLTIILFCGLIFRLFLLQITQGQMNQKLAEGNRIRPRIIEATRGVIIDQTGEWLAKNKPSFALALYPSDLPRKRIDREDLYNKLSEISGIDFDEIKTSAEKNSIASLDQVLLKENISHDEALLLEEKIADMPGVFIAKKAIREYRTGYGLGHMLGYTGIVSPEDIEKNSGYYLSDRIGKIGLEATYESELRGNHGIEQIEVDSKGNIVRVLADQENKEPEAGEDIKLSIGLGLQQKTAEALQAGIESGKQLTGSEVAGGVAIVMDVNTGKVRAFVSLPDYNNNLFSSKISAEEYKILSEDKSLPMFNRAIKGTYPPGSISKIILAAAGLSEKVINVNTSLDTPSEIKIGDYTFPDWKDHGVTDIETAIAESNNIFFYALGGGYDKIKGIGIEKMKKYWQLFGLGEKTGIDLPGEASGFLPDSAWKLRVKKEPWYIGDTYHAAIGQGDLLVTPLQMLRATAVIANGGKLLQPQLLDKVVDSKGNVVSEYKIKVIKENFIDSNILQTVAKGMRQTVIGGSARNLADLPVSVAGKTGTAQFLNNQKTHAWFTCYAPYENPEIAVLVLVEGGGGGHEIAAPVAKEILNYYFTNKK